MLNSSPDATVQSPRGARGLNPGVLRLHNVLRQLDELVIDPGRYLRSYAAARALVAREAEVSLELRQNCHKNCFCAEAEGPCVMIDR